MSAGEVLPPNPVHLCYTAPMQSPVRPTYGVLIWTAIAALALGLFAGMSLLAWNSSPRPAPSVETPTREPEDVATPGMSSSGAPETTPIPLATETSAASADPMALIGLWLSAVSAITALIGLASSLWLGWRKEGREVAQHRLELEKAQLEIQKLRQELTASGDTGKTS